MGQAGKPNVRRPFQADLLWESRNVQTRKKKCPSRGLRRAFERMQASFEG